MAGELNRLSQAQQQEVARKQIDAIKEIVTHTYGKAQTYANIITVAGYAAFFTMWVSMRSELPRIPMLLAGLLMTISALLFVSAEVQKMAATGLRLRKLQMKLMETPSPDLVTEIQSLEKDYASEQFKVWSWLFCPALVCGVFSAATLVGSFLFELAMELSK